MKDGSVGWNPGKLNPNIIRPVGPIDPEVGVVYLDTPQKKPLATFVNFAIHTDNTGGTRISADMPGALSRVLAAYKGPDMLTLFANGACGNVNQLNVQWGEPQTGTNEANRLGTILGAAVFKAYMEIQPVAPTTLGVRSELLELPLARCTDDQVRQARDLVQEGSKAKFMEQVQAYKTLDVHDRQGQPLQAEVQVIALGHDLAWVGLPGEIFVELGLSIKAGPPSPKPTSSNSPMAASAMSQTAPPTPRAITKSSAPAAPKAPAKGSSPPPCACSPSCMYKRKAMSPGRNKPPVCGEVGCARNRSGRKRGYFDLLTWERVVVPLISLATTRSGSPIGLSSSPMKSTPSGPKSPWAVVVLSRPRFSSF